MKRRKTKSSTYWELYAENIDEMQEEIEVVDTKIDQGRPI
jgi:hypothetical protein